MSVKQAGVPNTSTHPSCLPRLFCLKFHHCQRPTLCELQPVSLGGNLTLAHWCPLASFLSFFGWAAISSQIRKYKSTLWTSCDLPLGTGARNKSWGKAASLAHNSLPCLLVNWGNFSLVEKASTNQKCQENLKTRDPQAPPPRSPFHSIQDPAFNSGLHFSLGECGHDAWVPLKPRHHVYSGILGMKLIMVCSAVQRSTSLWISYVKSLGWISRCTFS